MKRKARSAILTMEWKGSVNVPVGRWSRMRAVVQPLKVWGGALAMMLVLIVSALGVESAPDDPRLVAAVFPPWWSASRTTLAGARAGDVMGFGALPFIVILHADQGGLTARANAAGAILTFARSRRGLCIG
jgi:hypothetical protein